ncbi:MAG: TetR/AcrR family transcriptional regulator [Planctomycetota bacterium]|nr:MAG: TetR/AcrR family transcriptional regulator [Planctomycetota bacterium]
MPRPDMSSRRRQEFTPILARVFADRGYRRTTTAELAAACGVRENILYRLWPDKQSMFVEALDYVYRLSETTWHDVLEKTKSGDQSPARVILEYEATHHGEFGFYRIIFAGLSETDDPRIMEALKRLYARFQSLLKGHLEAHQAQGRHPDSVDSGLGAWAIIGIGTVANIGRELDLISAEERKRLLLSMGEFLMDSH